MPKEVENKFLIISDEWRDFIIKSIPIKQAYIYTGPPLAVRVRIEPEKCTLNLKKSIVATTREEYEYQIPFEDAKELLEKFSTGHVIEKIRHIVLYEGQRWEIDEFLGENLGLIVAEIELQREDEQFQRPHWLGKEVSHDTRYLNTSLALYPFSKW